MFAQYTSEKDKHKDNDNQSKAKLQPVCFSLWENTMRVLSSDSSIDDNTCDESLCQNPWLLAVHFAHHRNVQLWAKTNIGTWFMYEAKWGTENGNVLNKKEKQENTWSFSQGFSKLLRDRQAANGTRRRSIFQATELLAGKQKGTRRPRKIITFRFLKVWWPLNEKCNLGPCLYCGNVTS